MPALLGVVKDLGPLEMIGPLLKAAKEVGFDVCVLTEGPSVGKAKERYGLDEIGYEEHLGSAHTFDYIGPIAVIVGASSPMNLERVFALASRKQGLPLVIVSDLPETWKRMEGVDHALVLAWNAEDQWLAKKAGFSAVAVGARQIVLPEPDRDAEALVERMHDHGKRVILAALSGQPARIADELECVLACSKMTSVPHVLIVQANPKLLPQPHPSGVTWENWIQKRIFREAMTMPGRFVLYADATISPSSSALTAMGAGKIGIGLRPAAAEQVMQEEPGVIPTLELYENQIGMPIIRQPCDLMSVLLIPRAETNTRPYDPKAALRAVEDYIRRSQ